MPGQEEGSQVVQEDWKGKQTRHHQGNLQVDHESFRKLGVDEAIGSFLLQQRKHHLVKDLLSKEETCCKVSPNEKKDMPCTLFQLTTMFHETGRKNVHEDCVGLFGLKGLFHRGKGVPLKGPFFAHFSQGNFGKVNEIVLFSVFRIFCNFSLLRLAGNSSLLRLVILTLLHSAIPAGFP